MVIVLDCIHRNDGPLATEQRTGGCEVEKTRIWNARNRVARRMSAPLLVLALVHPAIAQQVAPAGDKNAGQPGTPTLPPVEVRATGQVTQSDNVNDPDQVAGVSKTGTALKDLPASVQVIPRALLTEQGATMLRQGVSNASGVNVGGQDTKGYYDHFLIRGLNAQIFNDGFSDGDLLGGVSH